MATVEPLSCLRPVSSAAKELATLPVDVYSNDEVLEELLRNPRSFMHVDAAAMHFPGTEGWRADDGRRKARDLIEELLAEGTLIKDEEQAYYLYRMRLQNGHEQTGIICRALIDDYVNGIIKKHENTRTDKEDGCIAHVEACNAQTGPLFLSWRSAESDLEERIARYVETHEPLYDFMGDDGVQNAVWRVGSLEHINSIRDAFSQINALYIADGHHRGAAAVRAGLAARKQAEEQGGGGKLLPSDYIMSVIFPSDQLVIHDYNRAVADLNGLTKFEFLAKVAQRFAIIGPIQGEFHKPNRKGQFGMFLDGEWFYLEFLYPELTQGILESLDVSVLQSQLLEPILGITDPKTDPRLDFVRGTRGLSELENRCIHGNPAAVCFALFPTSINELFAVADNGLLAPPKSTWFEPKCRNGLFLYEM